MMKQVDIPNEIGTIKALQCVIHISLMAYIGEIIKESKEKKSMKVKQLIREVLPQPGRDELESQKPTTRMRRRFLRFKL
ncbi:hypothetical protein M3226_26425 [Neobacillus cucumis]|uniref:hypothetical protein n=1 Tax=Neobacillus cucumis TaxID=1740721 RepID=UPI00203B5E80|nr:hypothetical protein [Neobacillus cucumis]MCM3729152.1 hypothetical protein [Neobacillus cucumis]